jgi:hypothetical protein
MFPRDLQFLTRLDRSRIGAARPDPRFAVTPSGPGETEDIGLT